MRATHRIEEINNEAQAQGRMTTATPRNASAVGRGRRELLTKHADEHDALWRVFVAHARAVTPETENRRGEFLHGDMA